jgi:hypothetical protein
MLLWEIARVTGVLAFAALTVSAVWGVLLAGRALRPAAAGVVYHRFASTLGLAAVLIHVGVLMADRYAHVHPSTLVGLHARPGVLAGAAALWLALGLPLSFVLLRRRLLGPSAWRVLHYGGYAFWALALAHGLAVGSDRGSPWVRGVYAGAAMVVLLALAGRRRRAAGRSESPLTEDV